MENNIEKIIYEASIGVRDNHRFFMSMRKAVENDIIPIVEGNISAYYYDALRKLSDSINNAGHEERRSSDIKLINDLMCEISDKYEDFLP